MTEFNAMIDTMPEGALTDLFGQVVGALIERRSLKIAVDRAEQICQERLAETQAKVVELEKELTYVKSDAKWHNDSRIEWQRRHDAIRDDHHLLQKEHAGLQEQFQTAGHSLEDTRTELATAQNEVAFWHGKFNAAQDTIARMTAESVAERKLGQTWQDKCEYLESEVDEANDDINRLTDERNYFEHKLNAIKSVLFSNGPEVKEEPGPTVTPAVTVPSAPSSEQSSQVHGLESTSQPSTPESVEPEQVQVRQSEPVSYWPDYPASA